MSVLLVDRESIQKILEALFPDADCEVGYEQGKGATVIDMILDFGHPEKMRQAVIFMASEINRCKTKKDLATMVQDRINTALGQLVLATGRHKQ